MTLFKNKWLLPILFAVVIALNYLSTLGIILPNTQQAVSDKYLNYYAPAGFTFSVWGIIYLGVLLTIYLEFKHRNNPVFLSSFQKYVKPYMAMWMVLNLLWTLLWSYELLVPAFIAIALYGVVLFMLAINIASHPELRAETLFLVIPVGIHLGWIIAASFANLMTALTQNNLAGISAGGLVLTLLFMATALIIGILSYIRTLNFGIIIVLVWALAGIVMKHAPGTDFAYPNFVVFISGIAAAVIAAVSPIILKSNK